jgi:hypothetical protein
MIQYGTELLEPHVCRECFDLKCEILKCMFIATSLRMCVFQVGIRCALRLEVPVADKGRMLVSDDYIR